MWYPDGNCLVHLYARGSTASSTSGPAFLIPLEFLVGLDCIPLLDRFLAGTTGNPPSNRKFVKGRSSLEYTAGRYDLYMPPPPTAEGEQKLLCRTGTRNFFAWICGKPLVGESLGQALVGLLNSMSEYRGLNVDNVEDILDYMEEGGYADLGGSPVHTLATLHFAEHFQFENLYTDAFAHAVGMHDEVILSPEYKVRSTHAQAVISKHPILTPPPSASPPQPAPSSPTPTPSCTTASPTPAPASPPSSPTSSPPRISASPPPLAHTSTASAPS